MFYWNSKWPPQINFNFFLGGGAKNQKNCLVNFFFNFNITFLATWGCASYFLKTLPKFKMAAIGSIFFVGAKSLELKVGNYTNFSIAISTISGYGDVQVIFLRFQWNSKRPPWINFLFFCGRKKWKIEITNNSHCTITLPTIWKCACDSTVI